MKSHYRGREALKKLFAFLASFCVLCGALVLVHSPRSEAAGDYKISITANNTSAGGFGYGANCTGTIYLDYVEYSENSWTKPFPNGGSVITACPASGYKFDHWLVNGVRPSSGDTNPILYDYNTSLVYDANNEINVQAVFVDAYVVVASVDASVGGTIMVGQQGQTPTDYEAVPLGTMTNEIVFTAANTGSSVTTDIITATANYGYVLSSITASSPNVVINRISSNTFTLTISGDGTVNIVFTPITYTTTINAAPGTATVTSGAYTINDNGTGLVTVVSTTASTTIPVTISPPTGATFGSITANGVSYQNLSGNSFELTTWQDGGVATINYDYSTTNIAHIDISNGTLNAWGADVTVSGANTDHITATSTGTKTITVDISPSSGYQVNTSNPVTTTGDVAYNNDFNNGQLTLTISGDGTATINTEQITYSAAINAGAGTATVPQSANYSIANNGTSSVTVTSTSQNVSVPVTISSPNGYVVQSVSATNGATYNNDLSGNSFSFTMNSDGGMVSVTYEPAYVVTVDSGSGTAAISGTDIAVSGNNSSLATITAVGNKTANVTVTAPSGYRVDPTDPVTTTGSITASNFNNNFFTLTLTGAGTATVNYVEDTDTSFTMAPNNASYGGINYTDGWCGEHISYAAQVVYLDNYGLLDLPNYHAIACPSGDNTFDHWELDGVTISSTDALSKAGTAWPDDGASHTITAVFVSMAPDYTATASVIDSSEGNIRITSGTDFTANPSNQNAPSITLTSNNTSGTTVTILAVPNSGYALRHENISTTGDVSYNNDLNNNEFTVTMSGAGTVTVDFVPTRTATFTVNDSTYGDLVYEGDTEWGWGNLNCSASSHVATATFGEIENNNNGNIETQIDLPKHSIYACAKEGATFIGWKINGADIVNPLNERNIINRNGYADGGQTIKPLYTGNSNITVEAVFYYNVEIEATPSGAGDLQINNTSTKYIADPNSTRAGTIMLYVDPSQGTVNTNSLMTRPLSNDYEFAGFEFETGNVSHASDSQSGHILAMTGPDNVKAIFASTSRINYATSDPNVTIVEPGTTKAKSYDSIGVYDDDPTGASYIVDSSVAANYKLMYWQDENGVAVSTDETFVPTGSLIRAGATYTPVFDTTGNKRASVTINIPSAGHLRYWSNSQSRWVDLATGAGAILGVGAGDHFASNIYAVSDDPNYYLDHWDIITPDGTVIPFATTTCTEQGIDQAGCLDASQGTYGTNNYYHVVAVFKTHTINYASNPIPHTRGSLATIYEPYTNNEKTSDPTTNPSGAEGRSTNDYYFLYWSDEDDNIVSYDEIFVPTGGQIMAGATYYANFCNSNYSCVLFTVNDKTMGHVQDSSHGDITDYTGLPPVEFDCNANGCSPHVTVQALSNDSTQYFFHHWEISTDGENYTLLDIENLTAALNPSVSLPMSAGQRYIIKAVFTECETVCFHDYSYLANPAYDAGAWGYTEDVLEGGEVVGSEAIVRTDTSVSPYFAYWTTGCAGGPDGDFLNEKIVSLDAEFYPTAAELATCSDYIAIFYRSSEARIVVTTNYPENDALQVLINGDGETGKSATNYVNLGMRYDATGHPNLASVGRSMQAVAPPGYTFSHWTINGAPLENTDGDEITGASISRSSTADTTSANIPWFTPLSGQINILKAHFMPTLPFTGSFSIWLSLGGGIALVAIPSIILMISERKEVKKGGKI